MNTPAKKLSSLKQIHDTYGISVSMLRKLISNKQLAVTKVGIKSFITADAIENFIQTSTKEIR